jgi:hypothetical protein
MDTQTTTEAPQPSVARSLVVAFKTADGVFLPVAERDLSDTVWMQAVMAAALETGRLAPLAQQENEKNDSLQHWVFLIPIVLCLALGSLFLFSNKAYFLGGSSAALVQPPVQSDTATDTVAAARAILKDMGIDVKKQNMSCFGK